MAQECCLHPLQHRPEVKSRQVHVIIVVDKVVLALASSCLAGEEITLI
jgi:hypothetical protein